MHFQAPGLTPRLRKRLGSLEQAKPAFADPPPAEAAPAARKTRRPFDLDPDPSVPWDRMVEGAYELRERLERLGLVTWVKTTGGKGLHVVAPLARRQEFDEVREFSRRVVERMVHDALERYVATMSKAKRKGKIFVDYLRNGRGSTAIVPFSSRAHEAAPVAIPIRREELERGVRPDQFTVATLPRRLRALKRDPREGFLEARQSLTKRAWAALE